MLLFRTATKCMSIIWEEISSGESAGFYTAKKGCSVVGVTTKQPLDYSSILHFSYSRSVADRGIVISSFVNVGNHLSLSLPHTRNRNSEFFLLHTGPYMKCSIRIERQSLVSAGSFFFGDAGNRHGCDLFCKTS